MPNWCGNYLIVKGDKKQIKAFKEKSMGLASLEEIKNRFKNEVEKLYNDEVTNVDKEAFRNRIADYLKFKQMTPVEYYIHKKYIEYEGKYKIKGTDLSFNETYPRPKSLDITSGTSTSNGKAIILSREFNDHSEIDKILEYKWENNRKVMKTREEVIEYLINDRFTNLEEGKQAIENKKKYGFETWYEWNIANWGTKWDVKAQLTEDTETLLEYSFDSAWSPPVEWLEKVSEFYPDLHFTLRYSESGCGFKGEATAENGSINNYCEDWNPVFCQDCGSECEENKEGKYYCYNCQAELCPECYCPLDNETSQCPNGCNT